MNKSFLCLLFVCLSPLSSFGFYFPEEVVRMATANLSSGRYQNYDLGHGIRLIRAMSPDITFVQEFDYLNNSTSNIEDFVDSSHGEGFQYCREKNRQLPNGIVSRYPIRLCATWDDPTIQDRGFSHALIEIKSTLFLAISVHFSASHYHKRVKQAEYLVDKIVQFRKSHRKNLPVIIGGDFNTKRLGEQTLKILEEIGGEMFLAETPEKVQGTNASKTKPYDQIIESEFFDKALVPVSLAQNESENLVPYQNLFPNGLIFDPGDFEETFEPAEKGDSKAPYMQHHLVIKDYLLENF